MKKPAEKLLRRVVVTGLGAISPLGVGADTLWSEILAKRCGIAKLQDPGYFQN